MSESSVVTLGVVGIAEETLGEGLIAIVGVGMGVVVVLDSVLMVPCSVETGDSGVGDKVLFRGNGEPIFCKRRARGGRGLELDLFVLSSFSLSLG